MYLKNIEVHGFKSFAQKINFEFHNGITGIVGPNGSGKSNVGDAVRWVLGEQSAKQLRGGNMQDVIFSGTETRKPLSFASVAITLDNSDHKLPVDYNEVTVTRRLYRSGESEYLINGSNCRLKDIQEMFYDTGIGKEGYSIIGQGQIDKILSGKPEDRRELFDEAAGIVKFKRRKNTTIKKLEEEKSNLVRVTDILNELTKQLGPLEKQAKTAKIYLSRRDELRELDVNLFLLEYDHTGRLLKELEEKLGNTEAELREAEEEFGQTKAEYERLEQELEELGGHLDELKEKQQENALMKQEYESRIKILKEQIQAGKQNAEHYENRLNVLKSDLEKRNLEKEKLTGESGALKAQKREIQKNLDEGQERLKKILANVEECAAAVEDGKNEIIELLNSRATTKGKAQRFDAMMEQLDIRKAQVSQRILVLKTEEESLSGDRAKAEHTYQSVSSFIQSTNEECVRLDEEIQKLQEKLKELNRQMETGQAAYHREVSRLESLKNITERYEGYGNSIRRVMEQKKNEPGIRGVVADIIQVKKDYELAIETALGGSIQNIVTDNEQTAKRMIDFLKKNRYGRATFLPLSNISGRGGFQREEVFREPGVIGAADTLVQADREYDSLVKYLLGRVLVVDHIDHAIAIGKKYRHSLRMVTLEGDSLSPGGSMTGGAFKNNSNLLGRRREMEELERSIELLKKELKEAQQSINDNRSRRNVLRDTIADFQEKLRQQYVEQNTAKMNLEQIKEKEQGIKESYKQIEREQNELRRQAGEIRSDRSGIVKELEESQKDEKELEAFIETKQKELEEWRAEEAQKTKELEEIRLEESAVSQKERFLKENLDRISREADAFQEESRQMKENLENSAKETKKKEEGIQSLQAEVEKCRELETEFQSQREKWQKEKEERSVSH
ncbi:MAG TPA: chromosome segregation protein SMC, partial [Candidatus Blautia intestinipullorum]|nr:chromosome segregation protein SMC [Candidatus Blautia intestinipullorum]